MSKPDVLYRVRAGRNEHLRYSLRSLANVPHGEVFMVGYPPEWVRNVTVITPEKRRIKWLALVADLAQACAELAGRKLLLIDDDMFIVAPRDEVDVVHGGNLRWAAERKNGTYGRSLRATADYLENKGITDAVDYDLHIPLPIEADAMHAAIAPLVGKRRFVQARSIYGNMARLGGTAHADIKLKPGYRLPADYLSTKPASWPYWLPKLQRLFPAPGQYE